MTTTSYAATPLEHTGSGFATLKAFWAELSAFADAVLNPSKIIDEVQQMHDLLRQAYRVEHTDPAQAQALRQRASRLGLN